MQGRDTLIFAEKIELRTSPLKILFKTIYFRKIELTNAKIHFLKDEAGELNISKLAKPSEEGEEVELPSWAGKRKVILYERIEQWELSGQ